MNFKTPLVVHVLWICFLLVLIKVSTANQMCPAGFTGSNCSTDIDDCLNNNCSGNGNCTDHVNGYFCSCYVGFYGINCEIAAEPCFPNPCDNNGTCVQDGDLIKCSCTSDFEGDRCESEKPRQTFTLTLTMTDREYIVEYEDLTKPITRGLIVDLTNVFKPFFERNFEGLTSITFREFFSGSLGAIFDLTFKASSEVNKTSIIQALTTANGTSQLRFEFFGTIAVNDKLSPAATDGVPTESSKVEPWIIALIVSVIILLLLVVLIIVLVLKVKREKNLGKEEIAFDGYWELQADLKSMRLSSQTNHLYAGAYANRAQTTMRKIDQNTNGTQPAVDTPM